MSYLTLNQWLREKAEDREEETPLCLRLRTKIENKPRIIIRKRNQN